MLDSDQMTVLEGIHWCDLQKTGLTLSKSLDMYQWMVHGHSLQLKNVRSAGPAGPVRTGWRANKADYGDDAGGKRIWQQDNAFPKFVSLWCVEVRRYAVSDSIAMS